MAQTSPEQLKKTALFEEHKKLNGRMVNFGGWELPVQYTGVMEEHNACRNSVGLFDVSHMGEILISGNGSEAFLDYLLTNQISKMQNNQAQYNVMCNKKNGIVDDLVVYKFKTESYMLVVNASNTEKDFAWIQQLEKEFKNSHPSVCFEVQNKSADFTQIALQGKNAEKILAKLTDTSLSEIKYYWFAEGIIHSKIPAIISRTGYTGEDGFELYIPWNNGPELWQLLLEAGKEYGIKPCGLGARDTLRLEMKFPLYGHELSENTNPIHAGLKWVVKLEKENFIGKSFCQDAFEKRSLPTAEKLVGFKLLDRGIPRQDYEVHDSSGVLCGRVTSGTHSPSLGAAIGIAIVENRVSEIGTEIFLDIRGQKVKAQVVSTPFYKRNY